MRKKCITVALFVALTVVLGGCGANVNNTNDNNKNSNEANTNQDIGKEKACMIALADAGINETEVSRLYVTKDYDDGIKVYEVEFTNITSGIEYEYEIQASDGTIRKIDNQQNAQKETQAKVEISRDHAIKMILDKVPGATEKDVKIELDEDVDGYYKYEGNIIYDQKKYEFEIDANTGTILEWEER